MSEKALNLFYEGVDYLYHNINQLFSIVQHMMSEEKKSFSSINIIFCTDAYLLQLNIDHLSHDYYTDILTFQYEDDPIEGELFISLDRVKENALNLSVTEDQELERVIIHGILHLIGYQDDTKENKAKMRNKEDYYLSH